jgi:hypothetical protein
MRIVHVASEFVEVPRKKTAKEQRLERCVLMLKNQRTSDRMKADLMFKDRLSNIQDKLKH